VPSQQDQPQPSIHLRVPAKLNQFLHITGRRADGYHLLQTLFRAINLYDEIALTLQPGARITRSIGPADVPPEQDLCVRAARLLQTHTGTQKGVDMQLHKQIPMGAGMGGGSSNAAGVLQGLNQLWQTQLSQSELAALALTLGADVPFFLRGGDQWAEGIGEQLQAITLPKTHYLVLFPGVHCDTRLLFAHPQLKRDCAPIARESYTLASTSENVFEAVVLTNYPEVARAHAWLTAQAGNARLTGSGSALFAQVPNHKRAQELKRTCPAPWRAWFASTLGNL
jgi:4-diphosphocytidyl-2-C-methyl-D-erythritol kinase